MHTIRPATPPPHIHPLRPLPRLRAQHKHHHRNKHHRPLPANARVHKHNMVNDGNVQRPEHDEEDDGDGEEEEAVAPEVHAPGAEPAGHVEQRAPRVDELPREEQEDPRHGRVAGGARAEHVVARRRVLVVAVGAEVAVVEAEYHDGEGPDGAARHEDAVGDHVEQELGAEDAVFEL